jgi:voltage-gated potassium channel
VIQVMISIIIIVNVVFVLTDTLQNQPRWLESTSRVIEAGSVTIFTAEYLARLWTADLLHPEVGPVKARIRFATSWMGIIDLLAIAPFFIPLVTGGLMTRGNNLRVLRLLRIVRLARVLKLGRYSEALSSVGRALRRSVPALLSSVFVILLLLIVASVLVASVEGWQPVEGKTEIYNAFDALWWAVATITTVGYGDFVPITPMGRFLGSIVALLGIGLIAVPTGIISAAFLQDAEASEQENSILHAEGQCQLDDAAVTLAARRVIDEVLATCRPQATIHPDDL